MTSITTEAYVVHEPKVPLKLQTVHYDKIGDHELLVETVAVSICHTDIRAANGNFFVKPPMIPGHESSGYVKQVGPSVTKFKPGDAVVLSFASCSVCPSCLSGRAAYCDEIFNLNFSGSRGDGSTAATDAEGKLLNNFFFGQSSMGKLVLAREWGAVKVECTREELKKFAALTCGIQTGAGAILNILKPPANSSLAIWGAGAVGLSACLAAKLSSPSHIILIDVSQSKLDSLPSSWLTHPLCVSTSAKEGEVATKIKELMGGRGVDYAIDAVGSGSVLREAHMALKAGGTLVTIGGSNEEPGFKIEQHLVKGITYRGTHQGDAVPRVFIPQMIELWRQGKFPFDEMLTYFPFSELDRALAETNAGRVIKPVLICD